MGDPRTKERQNAERQHAAKRHPAHEPTSAAKWAKRDSDKVGAVPLQALPLSADVTARGAVRSLRPLLRSANEEEEDTLAR
jgi:hypothetical protein